MIYLSRYLAKWDGYSLSEQGKKNADVNLDGKVTDKDSYILDRHLAGWEGYEKLPYVEIKKTVSGDIDGDGKITSSDAKLVSRFLLKVDGYQMGDVNKNGKVDEDDAIYVKKIATGYGDVATAADYTKGDGKLTQEDADAILKKSTGN